MIFFLVFFVEFNTRHFVCSPDFQTPEWYTTALRVINVFFVILFSIECIVKVQIKVFPRHCFCYSYKQLSQYMRTQYNVHFFCAVVQLIAFGVSEYWHDNWNKFDFIVVAISITGLIVEVPCSPV